MRGLNRTQAWLSAVLTAAILGAAPAVADADTLGSVTNTTGAPTVPCVTTSVLAGQFASDPTPFIVPGPGEITQWETNQTGNSAPGGEQVGFVVLRKAAGGYDVVGSDLETLPATLPQNGIVTFRMANPIEVSAGDLLGLWSPATTGQPLCYFGGQSLIADTVVALGPLSGSPVPGQIIPLVTPDPEAGLLLDLAATFIPITDAGVATTAGPANAIAGEPALLSSTVTGGEAGNVPVTFTDAVPAGLTIDSAVAGSGLCSTAGQLVTCTISGLAPGQSAPVQIVVTPTAAGSYRNAVSISVTPNATDPNPANDAASATLPVMPAPVAASAQSTPSAPSGQSAPPAARCVVPSLKRIPASFARRVLGLLDCQVGVVRQVHSKTVAKGQVIRSTPGPGTYAAGRRVALQISSGPARKRK